jgi:tetratricopeptide (TPR) repeat protein
MADIPSALKHWNNALAVMGDAFGRDHTETAETLTGLGNAYNALGEKDKALEYHLRSLRILEDWLGVDHVLVAGTALGFPVHICTGTGLARCHICAGTALTRCHIGTGDRAHPLPHRHRGPGSPAATSAPGLGSLALVVLCGAVRCG